MAGALAEEGVGLEEITKRVNLVAKAMGEYQPQGWEDVADLGIQRRLLPAASRVSLEAGGRSPAGDPEAWKPWVPGFGLSSSDEELGSLLREDAYGLSFRGIAAAILTPAAKSRTAISFTLHFS